MPIVYMCKLRGFILHVFAGNSQDSYGVPPPSEQSLLSITKPIGAAGVVVDG